MTKTQQQDQSPGHLHLARAQQAANLPRDIKDVVPRNIARIGIIGGGTMGAGIATAALLSGFKVVLLEMNAEAASAATRRILGNIKGALVRGKIDQEKLDQLMGDMLTAITSYASLSDVDLVVEAVFEDMQVKKQVFAQLDAICKDGCVLATNTSYLDVNELAGHTRRPEDVIGLHFFSPAHVMKLLEIVVADKTSPEVTATGFAVGRALGKIAVRSGVCDGFIGNRILSHYRTCADHMVIDGASPFQIDQALTAFGFAMGPYAVADLAGLDIGWMTRKRKAPHRHPEERIPTYLDKLCEQGLFGRKTGEGVYVYSSDRPHGIPNAKVAELIAVERAENKITPRDFSDEEIVLRYMCAMVNEAAVLLGEGVAQCPSDIDLTLVFGYGFPRRWGGPMKWADLQGLDTVLNNITLFAQNDRWFWRPAPLLTQLVAEGRRFDDLNSASSS